MEDKLLISLGLSPKEAKLYKAVLRHGTVTPSELAKAAGIKRTTAYSMARGLVEKGLLVEESDKRPRKFVLATPRDIERVSKEERERLSIREKLLKEFAGELSRTEAEKSYPVPRIRFIEEDKLEKFLYATMPHWQESVWKNDSTWWGFQDHTFVEHFRDFIDWQWKHAPKHEEVKLLSNQSETETKLQGKYPKRSIKLWNKSSSFISTTWVAGEYVIMVQTRRKPFYLVEIHDATLANDMREVFKNLWPLV